MRLRVAPYKSPMFRHLLHDPEFKRYWIGYKINAVLPFVVVLIAFFLAIYRFLKYWVPIETFITIILFVLLILTCVNMSIRMTVPPQIRKTQVKDSRVSNGQREILVEDKDTGEDEWLMFFGKYNGMDRVYPEGMDIAVITFFLPKSRYVFPMSRLHN